MAKKFEIRNSTAEFLIFMLEGKEDGIQVMYHDETIWCTQKAMSTLFDCSTDNIGLHLKNIFTSGELRKDSTTEFFSVVQTEGGRQVSRKTLCDHFCRLSCKQRSCYTISPMVHIGHPAIRYPWLCDRQEAYGERLFHR